MPVSLVEKDHGNLEVWVTGKLAHADYQILVPVFERMVKEHGRLRVLFEMVDFHGWEPEAVLDDVKFDVKHFSDIDRLAMVGDKDWERKMSFFCKAFTTAKVRYFDSSVIDEARAWLARSEGVLSPTKKT